MLGNPSAKAFCAAGVSALEPAHRHALEGRRTEMVVECIGHPVRVFVGPLLESGTQPRGVIGLALAQFSGAAQ